MTVLKITNLELVQIMLWRECDFKNSATKRFHWINSCTRPVVTEPGVSLRLECLVSFKETGVWTEPVQFTAKCLGDNILLNNVWREPQDASITVRFCVYVSQNSESNMPALFKGNKNDYWVEQETTKHVVYSKDKSNFYFYWNLLFSATTTVELILLNFRYNSGFQQL